MLDLDAVLLFTKAVEVGSLSAAATALGMPKSTASRSLARRGNPEKVADLAQHDVLDWPWPEAPNEWTLSGDFGEESVRVAPRLSANDGSVLRHAVLAGTGIAWLAPFLCMDDVQEGRLVRLLPGWRRDPLEIHAVFPVQREVSPKVRAFVDFLVERMRIPAASGERKDRGA